MGLKGEGGQAQPQSFRVSGRWVLGRCVRDVGLRLRVLEDI